MNTAQKIRENVKSGYFLTEKEILTSVTLTYKDIVRCMTNSQHSYHERDIRIADLPKLVNLLRKEGFGVIINDELKGIIEIDYIEEKVIKRQKHYSSIEIFVFV